MGRRGRGGSGDTPEELRIKQLSDEEVVTQLNTLVEAWEQLEDVKKEIRVFESNTGEPGVLAHQFGSTEEFIEFNQRRRERVRAREELHRQRDSIDARFQESANVIKVLLPPRCSLIHHHHANFRHVIENRDGQIVVLSKREQGQQP